MGKDRRRRGLTAVCAALVVMLAVSILAGCGGAPDDGSTAVTDTATAFLNALGDRDVEALRPMMSQGYLDSGGVPDPITSEQLIAALGYMNSYRFIPEEDITIEGDHAVINVDMELAQKGTQEDTLALVREDGAWKVDAFTALDWSRKPAVKSDDDSAEAEQALRDFLIACVDGDTEYIFEHLSPDYKERYHLDGPWTAAEFSSVFGKARSFDFNAEEIAIVDGTVEIDVTVEFGTRGNLESETARVGLVKEAAGWLIDTFPFFIY